MTDNARAQDRGRPVGIRNNPINAPPPNAEVQYGRSFVLAQELRDVLELERLLQQCKTMRTEKQQIDAWADAAEAVKLYSDNMIRRWNKEIDVYLVFAALFSAILTAFNVESYKLLRPSPDNTAISLQRISMQLQSFSISPPFVNATHSAFSDGALTFLGTPSPTVPEYVVKLNTLWFSSLILSLHSTIIGIFVKQWTGEYGNGLTGTSRVAARLRQYRLNNLLKWRVGYIIALIPILLVISVALFLVGLLILLRELHPTVARVALALVCVVAASATTVTLLPLFIDGCAYLSPQTQLLLFLWRFPIRLLLRVVCTPLTALLWIMAAGLAQLLSFLTGKEHRNVAGAWMRLGGKFPWILERPRPWRAEEQSTVNRLKNKLDVDMLITWYDTTLHIDAVSSAAACLLDQCSDFVLEYFSRLDKAVKWHLNAIDVLDIVPVNDLLVWQVLLCAVDMSGMGLLLERHLSGLSRIGVYLSTGSKNLHERLITAVVGGLRTAAAKSGYGLKSGSALACTIKEVPLYANVRVNVGDIPVASLEEDMASLQQRMSRCLASALAEAPRASGHATRLDYSISLLNCLRSADMYLSCAARILSDPPLPLRTTTASLDSAGTNTIKVLHDVRRVVFEVLYNGRYREDLGYGCSDYHNLLCNIITTFNNNHSVFYPLLKETFWVLSKEDSHHFNDLRLRLQKEKEKGEKLSSLIKTHSRYQDTDATPENSKDAMDRHIECCNESYVDFWLHPDMI